MALGGDKASEKSVLFAIVFFFLYSLLKCFYFSSFVPTTGHFHSFFQAAALQTCLTFRQLSTCTLSVHNSPFLVSSSFHLLSAP